MKYRAGLAVALVALIGCGGRAQAPAPKASEAPAPEPLSEVEVIEIEAGGELRRVEVPRVVLLDAGAGERAPLRWSLQPKMSELDVTLRGRTSRIGHDAVSEEGDVVEARVAIAVLPGLDARTAMVAIEVLDARLVETTGYERYADVAAIKGERCGIHMTLRGQPIGYSVINGVEPSATMIQLTDQIGEALLMLMPEEPVGVGARWRTRRPVELASILMLEETVYTLEQRDDTTAVVRASVDRRPLTDLKGIVPADQLDSQRTRDAIAQLGDQPLSVYIRAPNPSALGEWVATFSPTSLLGRFERRVTQSLAATVDSPSGPRPLAVKIVEEVVLTSTARGD